MLPEQQQRILGYFIEEAKDYLNIIEQGLLNLQSTLDDPEMINEVSEQLTPLREEQQCLV
ncbi:MAG: hypothetical protein HC773_17410 [Scytonema sp. CRU_2_7]|nr:hypothetical protein [Scytonema sp. CRU_2_7]